MSFPLTLKRLRLERGLTQAALAGLSGIAQPNLAAMEQGRRQPTLPTLGRLATALGCGPEELLREHGSGLDRSEMSDLCRALVFAKRKPSFLDSAIWRDLSVVMRPKLQALRPRILRKRLRVSPRAAESRLKARLGSQGFQEVVLRLGKSY
jgi:transcriptional regulator with XRE-family HTH domain